MSHSHNIGGSGHNPAHARNCVMTIWTPDTKATKQDIERCLNFGERTTKTEAPIVAQPCGKSPPKGINFVPAVGSRYQAWIGD